MNSLTDIFRTLAPRVIAAILLLTLSLGARAQVLVGSCLMKVAPASQAPIEEEEEHRHEAKGKASTADRRRQRDRVPPPRRSIAFAFIAWVVNRSPAVTPSRVIPERESDLRNGLGAPLLC